MSHAALLALGLEQLIPIIIALAPIVLFVAKMLQGQAPNQRRPAPPRPPAAGEPDQAEGLRKEIERFLKQVTGEEVKRDEPKPEAPKRPQRQRAERGNRQPKERRVRPASEDEVVEVEVVGQRSRVGKPLGDSVGRHVSQHLDMREYQARASRLGAEIDQADEKLQQHLHDKFDRGEASRYAWDETAMQAAPTPDVPIVQVKGPGLQAVALANALGNPDSVQQAVVIAEILNRPVDRW